MGGTIRRRDFIASAFTAGSALAFGPAFLRNALAAPAVAGPGPYGELGPPNAVRMRLPAGFTGREIARGGEVVGGYPWHFATDGQAAYRTTDGGFVLVANSEAPGVLGGGSSAIRFSPGGEIQRAYRILGGTNINCAGGPTPWGAWLSCEEHEGGMVWEADPAGVLAAQPRPALGNFAHEAAAVDPVHQHVYLTEDEGDSCFYRFTPDAYPSLLSGRLDVAAVGPGGAVTWHEVPDPNIVTAGAPTREQVPAATRFDGGEGLWYDSGTIYFTTKGDKKVWAYDTASQTLEVLFDRALAPTSSLDAVDNVTVSAFGDVYVCEDGGNMEIGLISTENTVSPFVQLVGTQHAGSEMVGVVFDPSGTRMYFGSQRAYPFVAGTPAARGAVYEVTGPFRLPAGGVPDSWVYGPPMGERGLGLPAPLEVPGLSLTVGPEVGAARLSVAGLSVRVRLDEPSTVTLALRTAELETAHSPRWIDPRPVLTTLGRAEARLPAGSHDVRIPALPLATARLAGRGGVPATVTAVARTRSGARRVALAPVRLG